MRTSVGGLAAACAMALAAHGSAARARDNLGMYERWGAFRDAAVPRCYAIALAEPRGGDKAAGQRGYVDVGSWPRRQLRNKLHVRLSRAPAAGEQPRLAMGGQRFVLMASGRDAWPREGRDEAAILAAMRSAAAMTVSARGADGKLFTESFRLAGAASAIDSALVGCAGQ